MVIYTLRTLWAKALCLSVISSVLSTRCLRSCGWRPAWLSVLMCRLTKHTVQQVTGSMDDVLLFFFFLFSLSGSFCATSESSGVSCSCPWLLNSPLSWCGCIKVHVTSSLCVDVSVRKDGEVCRCHKWGLSVAFYAPLDGRFSHYIQTLPLSGRSTGLSSSSAQWKNKIIRTKWSRGAGDNMETV